jgi:MOSC domain-containing protein YiiM
VLCRVIESGHIRRGDRVEMEVKARAPHHGNDDSLSGAF